MKLTVSSEPSGLLRCRRVPSAARAHPQILAVVGLDLNSAVMAVRFEVSRFVGNGVLAAEFVLNFEERVGHVANLEREKRTAAGGVGDALKNFIARSLGAADIGADGVNDGLGALRHLDGFFAGDVAGIVLAIT